MVIGAGRPPLTREALIAALHQALLAPPEGEALAAWLGGSDATGRSDALSDVDLVVISENDHAAQVFERVERCLEALGGVQARYVLPLPTWHGHAQAFYRLVEAPPTCMVDLVVMQRSAGHFMLEPERHGQHMVLFDPHGLYQPQPLDRAAHDTRMARALDTLRARHALFAHLPGKQLQRGDTLAAWHFYQGMLLRPLVTLLRARHCPERFDFGLRYTRDDLPPEAVTRLERLTLLSDPEALGAAIDEAEAWIDSLLSEGAP